MNEKAERINGWAAMMGIVAAMGAYAVTIPGYSWCMVMDMSVIAAMLIGGFVFWAAFLTDDIDDDDNGPDDGMLTPAYVPSR